MNGNAVVDLSHCYLEADGWELFTAVLKPASDGRFPAVLVRTPYVDELKNCNETDVLHAHLKEYASLVEHGYAVIVQHCRGCGKSSGHFIPHIYEREDGLRLQSWIRTADFYNGEIFLLGSSYLSSVHYATAPFAPDIRGAVLGFQDCDRYNICFRNGFFKKALFGVWYAGMYRQKEEQPRVLDLKTFDVLPFSKFSETVFGVPEPNFDEMLRHPDRDEAYWGKRNVVSDANIPLLLTAGLYDIYTGGIFRMWETLDQQTRAQSAMLVSPYAHGDNQADAYPCDRGLLTEQFGDYTLAWFQHIRLGTPLPFETGKISYYRMYEKGWACEPYFAGTQERVLPLGTGTLSYVYDPNDAPGFRGGLSCNFGGGKYQDSPNMRGDIKTVYTEPFAEDTFVKGRMSMQLSVRSDREDSCFYVRISIELNSGDFGLRDDILSLCGQGRDYVPGTKVKLNFRFDEHAFLIRKGQRLRIDIASADNTHYVRHTNRKGLFCDQTSAQLARQEIFLDDSFLVLPAEN